MTEDTTSPVVGVVTNILLAAMLVGAIAVLGLVVWLCILAWGQVF